jgi:hypothetical protein
MGEILGGCSEPRNSKCYNRPVRPNSVMREFSLKDKESNANHRLKVQAFLILERLAGSKDLRIGSSSGGRPILLGKPLWELSRRAGKPCSLCVGTGRKNVLWPPLKERKTRQFCPSSKFALPAADPIAPSDFSMLKNFVLNSAS